MSSPEPPTEEQHSDSPNQSAESDQLDGAGGSNHIPPDPLLGTGSFIDPDTTTTIPHHANRNGKVDHIGPTTTTHVDLSPEEPVAEVSTPVSASAAEATPASRRNRRTLDEVTAAGRPEWLPEGWIIDCRVRTSGATAGTVDRYFKEPGSGRRFRSKNEVLHFLETGSKMKKKQAPDGDNMPSETTSTGARKRKNPASQSKEPAGFIFDFDNPPEMVTWTLEDADEDRWSASIDGEKVPEATQKEWATVFDYLSNHKP